MTPVLRTKFCIARPIRTERSPEQRRFGVMRMQDAILIAALVAGCFATAALARPDVSVEMRQPLLPNVHRFDRPQWAFRFGPPLRYRFGFGPDLEHLHKLTGRLSALQGIPVEAPYGTWAGRLLAFRTRPSGRATEVEIALNQRVTVWVDASDVRYDPRDHVAFTDISRKDLWDLPSATVIRR